MTTTIVLDLETARAFDEVVGRDPALLGVTLVGVYRYDTNQFRSFTEYQFKELDDLLVNIQAIIGFNIDYFDLPALQPNVKANLKKIYTIDILTEIKKELGFRISLDSIAQATLGIGKSGDGLKAIKYYKEGRIDELARYCLDDVKITKEIYEFGLKNGYFKYWSKDKTEILQGKATWKDHRNLFHDHQQPTLF